MVRIFKPEYYETIRTFVIIFDYKNGKIEVGVISIAVSKDKMPETFEIIVNGKSYGLIHYLKEP